MVRHMMRAYVAVRAKRQFCCRQKDACGSVGHSRGLADGVFRK